MKILLISIHSQCERSLKADLDHNELEINYDLGVYDFFIDSLNIHPISDRC